MSSPLTHCPSCLAPVSTLLKWVWIIDIPPGQQRLKTECEGKKKENTGAEPIASGQHARSFCDYFQLVLTLLHRHRTWSSSRRQQSKARWEERLKGLRSLSVGWERWFENVVSTPADSALPGDLLEMQMLGPHPRLTESEILGVQPRNLWGYFFNIVVKYAQHNICHFNHFNCIIQWHSQCHSTITTICF